MGLYQTPDNPPVDMLGDISITGQVAKGRGDLIEPFLLSGDTYADRVASTLATRVEPPLDRSSDGAGSWDSQHCFGKDYPKPQSSYRVDEIWSASPILLQVWLMDHLRVIQPPRRCLYETSQYQSRRVVVRLGTVAYEVWWVADHGDREREHRATLIGEIDARLRATTETILNSIREAVLEDSDDSKDVHPRRHR
ncbi:hypothetical protein JCGZ_00462 [Jatropha curcas]|uniref:Aminotransferase-like plant mobile domain-containing protein n=1 Tax=Jatropha curcas TaxID=180498 RepID=A0A067JGS4_JATCU|nr:hypothetical protein JCGZ_00462 [Jatropha curcas]